MTDEQHQQWKKDLEELHDLKAENKRLREKRLSLVKHPIGSDDKPNRNCYSRGMAVTITEHAPTGYIT